MYTNNILRAHSYRKTHVVCYISGTKHHKAKSTGRKKYSIADRVKVRCKTLGNHSITSQIVAQRKLANPVLDTETNDLLEYHKLLHTPTSTKEWSFSAANEFRLQHKELDDV